MEKSYRIKANVGKDQVLNVNLKRDVDLYEVLSLKIKQEKLYKMHSSDYGVIVGRVLANDAFGIPNAKVSVFIPINDKDKLRSDIKSLYPYSFINSYDSKNIRFNTLPDYKTKKCYKPVGTFSKKRLILDEDVKLEVYDKYYKFTTITNNAGDYMIFGVPTGEQTIHVDIDLSDIGVLSQRPTDFIYKGYSINLFENPSEFKKSTNLDELPQIISENATINVYPFWGDVDNDEIAITRKDIRVQYKFEPTCVFLGSVITDSSVNSISHGCTPSTKVGDASQLVASEGTIEMIRKTIDDKVEEYSIKGNKLIDGDGVFCYQIPMNLDFVATDEYGNIVPTDNPTKGIPTRARVRFRFTLSETDNEELSAHRARFLVPNNPALEDSVKINNKETPKPYVNLKYVDGSSNNASYYEFGSLTNNECFRDLLWNKVYSIKSYIPRVQKQFGFNGEESQEYIGIKGVNKRTASGINTIPFNKLNLNFAIPSYYIIREIWKKNEGIKSLWNFLSKNQVKYNIDAVREKVLEDMDAIGLDFYNDWLNGCLYFPNWYWYMALKKAYKDDEPKYDSQFCDCDKDIKTDNSIVKLCVLNNCSLDYQNSELVVRDYVQQINAYNKNTYGSQYFDGGIIKKVTNKDGAVVYYYSFGQRRYPNEEDDSKKFVSYVRLFSTDIILLGSLNDDDIHGIPKVSYNYPSTTAVIPPIGKFKPQVNDVEASDTDTVVTDEEYTVNNSTVNGMNWGDYWFYDGESRNTIPGRFNNTYKNKLASGLFFGLSTGERKTSFNVLHNVTLTKILKGVFPYTDIKSCVNAERICELGVSNDSDVDIEYERNVVSYKMDGLITKREIQDVDTRVSFATLNSDKLIGEIESDSTGYKTYNLFYYYPCNFDGRMEKISVEYTSGSTAAEEQYSTKDLRNKDYLDFRFGSQDNDISVYTNISYGDTNRMGGSRSQYEQVIKKVAKKRHFYGEENGMHMSGNFVGNFSSEYTFPLYNNSFYFYFGINSGHNAIGEFYNNFMPICKEDDKSPFNVEINQESSIICGKTGRIMLSVNGAYLPYKITLTNSDNSVNEVVENVNVENYSFSGLSNGEYTVEIEDFVGNIVTNEVVLSREKISVNYRVSSSIQVKYTGDNAQSICENNEYGILVIDSYKNNDYTVNINNLNAHLDGNDLVINLASPPASIKIGVLNSSDTNMANYCCNPISVNNEIHIKKPGTFYLRISDATNTSCSTVNYSDYTFTISDSNEMDMRINYMPLKFFVGERLSNLNTYPNHFYNKNGYNSIENVRGWFGVHDPNTYADIFNKPEAENYDSVWEAENSLMNSNDILSNKFKMLFSISSAAYVVNSSVNKFKITAQNNPLIRSAYPKYDLISDNEGVGTFISYITCNVPETNENGVNNSPNIVGENYRIKGGDGTVKDNSDLSGSYGFNPKYNSSSNCAGNYFAAFSNKANYIDDCTQLTTAKKYKSVPYSANDLSSYDLCINDEAYKNGIISSVYGSNPYFKTEFIDRRLDYDFVYVTPTKLRDKATTDTTWANGRMSGLTYNGIEMLYDGQYAITSENRETEYNYDIENKTISYNNNSAKRLYKSELDYGGTKSLDLRELYWCKKRTNISNPSNNDNIKVVNHAGNVTGNEFDNFGLDSNKSVIGYPTKRLVDIYNIPYNNGSYEWISSSCKYDNNFSDFTRLKALKDDDISHKIDFDNALNMLYNNVIYKYAGNYRFYANVYKSKFTFNRPSVNGLATKVEEIRLIGDNESHTSFNSIKTSNTNNLYGLFTSMTLQDYSSYINNPNGIEINKTGLNSKKFIGIGIYYTMKNSSNDSLLKRIKVFNISNLYNIKDITFMPDATSGDWVEVIKTTTDVDNLEGYVTTTGGTDLDVEFGDASVTTKVEKLNFALQTDAFVYDDINDASMEVTLGPTQTYTPTITDVFSYMKMSVLLTGSNVSIKNRSASIKLNINLKNGVSISFSFVINYNGVMS